MVLMSLHVLLVCMVCSYKVGYFTHFIKYIMECLHYMFYTVAAFKVLAADKVKAQQRFSDIRKELQ